MGYGITKDSTGRTLKHVVVHSFADTTGSDLEGHRAPSRRVSSCSPKFYIKKFLVTVVVLRPKPRVDFKRSTLSTDVVPDFPSYLEILPCVRKDLKRKTNTQYLQHYSDTPTISLLYLTALITLWVT